MIRVPFVFLADELDQLRIQHDALMHGDGPWLGVSLGIVKSDFNYQVSVVGPAEALNQFDGLSQWAALDVEPSQIAEARGFHH